MHEDGTLALNHALADNPSHDDVFLTRQELFALDRRHPTFYADSWSHLLGAKSARSLHQLVYDRCYAGDRVRPLPDDVAREFHVDGRGRADPAHLDGVSGEAPAPRHVAKVTTTRR